MDTNVGMNWDFEKISKDQTKIIKVIGIGGGGVNSVDYMYNAGINGVNFAVCNTDAQSFKGVNVPDKVILGSGLGSGGRPEVAKAEFLKSEQEVESLLSDGTRMIFLASGMGGGTGSGASPLLAKMARDRGILTIGIVTIPFLYERIPRIIEALDAVEALSKNVDALIVINNERLKEFYADFDLNEAFKKPNEVLTMAVKSIAEIITVKGIINRDFNDVTTTMKDSGVALVSYGFGRGENRLDNAIQDALTSPLLNHSDIYNAKRILFYLSFKKEAALKVEELEKSIDPFMARFDDHIQMNWGFGLDESLTEDQEVKFTIIATGFGMEVIPDIEENKEKIKAWKGEEELRSIIEEEEKRKKEEEKRKKNMKRVQVAYGGQSLSANIKVNRVTQSNIVVLTVDEMDNDEFINFLEKHPTYNRTLKDIATIRKPVKETVIKTEQAVVSIKSEPKEASWDSW